MEAKRGYIKNFDIDEFQKMDLTLVEYLIYKYIKGFRYGYYSTVTNIARCFRIHRKTARKSLNKLIENGYIVKINKDNKTLYMVKNAHDELSENDRQGYKISQTADKNDRPNGQKCTTNNNINNNYYNYSYNKKHTQNKKIETTYDLDEYTIRAINDPLIFRKKK